MAFIGALQTPAIIILYGIQSILWHLINAVAVIAFAMQYYYHERYFIIHYYYNWHYDAIVHVAPFF
jgi:hypothetical protein